MAVTPRNTKPKTSAKTDVAGRRVAAKGEPSLASYAEKDITPVTQDYIDWLKAETGYDVDPLSVQLSSVLRGNFQKSEGNQARIARRAEERVAEAEAREEAKAAREQAKAERDEARAARAAEPKAEKAVKTAPTKAAAKPAAKKAPAAPAKPAVASRRRPTSKPAEAGTDF